MPVLNHIAALEEEMTAWRHDFHRHPELDFDVKRTAGKIAALLRDFGCDEVVEGIGRTGVVGLIKGAEPGDVTGLRADMDALPRLEKSGAAHASLTPGKMHACGHDGHCAMLLGAAKHLAETRNFAGAVAVIFQPAEETTGGGREMVEDGLMERFAISRVFGMHNMPGLPVGQFAIRPGPMLASVDDFRIQITGKGGHAAKPHMNTDPTIAAAHLISAINAIRSRNADPVEKLVISVTSCQTGEDSYNVIPQICTLKGTVRAFREEERSQAADRLAALANGVSAAYGASAEFIWETGYPATVNDEREAAFAADVAEEIAGSCLRDIPPRMGAEDFSYMLNARPGAMIWVGNGPSAQCHHPAYDFADETMKAGASWWVRIAERASPRRN